MVTRQSALPPEFCPEIRLNPGRGSKNPASLTGRQEIQADINGRVTARLVRCVVDSVLVTGYSSPEDSSSLQFRDLLHFELRGLTLTFLALK